jgi:hypothetical protein
MVAKMPVAEAMHSAVSVSELLASSLLFRYEIM